MAEMSTVAFQADPTMLAAVVVTRGVLHSFEKGITADHR
jgi:hypothetical protein